MPTALITGVDGQDGSYLAEFLLEKGYTVIGWTPDQVKINVTNLVKVQERITLTSGSLESQESIDACVQSFLPDEVYNLAAPSSPSASWGNPIMVSEVAGLGVMRLLEALRRFQPNARFFQASTSEMFGHPLASPQTEETPLKPHNPYGIAKTFAHNAVSAYRDKYGMAAAAGIFYNHESPRRGLHFVTRKIIHEAVRIKLGLTNQLSLGNLDSRRDWGSAPEYVQAMWMMLQNQPVEDFVIGTGVTHSVRDWCINAFELLDLDYQQYVVVDPALYHPAESILLVADPSKIYRQLGWRSQTPFTEIVRGMLNAELQAFEARSAG